MEIKVNGEEIVVGEKEYICYFEGFWGSIITDTFTIGTLLLSFWFNHRYCGDSVALSIVNVVLFFAVVNNFSSSTKKKFTSKKKLIEYLEKMEVSDEN